MTRKITIGRRVYVDPPMPVFVIAMILMLAVFVFACLVFPIWVLSLVMPLGLTTAAWLAFVFLFVLEINGRKVWRHLLGR